MRSAGPDFSILSGWTRGMAALAAASVDSPVLPLAMNPQEANLD
jgi:hypothetical protein